MATNRQRVLDHILRFSERDDDEIARSLAISPRQAVNAICRELEAEGLIHRKTGPRGKIVNIPASVKKVPTSTVIVEPDSDDVIIEPSRRQPLDVETLTAAGFRRASSWVLGNDRELKGYSELPPEPGVYAFVKDGRAQYVGIASMGLRKRLRFYAKPGVTQRTSQRLNGTLKEQLAAGAKIDIYIARPPNFDWNGLPVDGCAGLEVGLIAKFDLPWNMRGAR